MRMRKKPWAEEMIARRSDCVIAAPERYRGTWSRFSRDGSVHLEIGAGKGDYWIAMAHQYPASAWIAVEKDRSCAAIALKKSLDDTTDNMKLIIGDAGALADWFAEAEVDVIHLNFSDPWPKKRQAKRRLTARTFLAVYRRILKPQGELILKTDNPGLFEFSLLSAQQDGWTLKEVSVDWRREEHPEDAVSEYERGFMAQGQPIYRAVWTPREVAA